VDQGLIELLVPDNICMILFDADFKSE